MAGAQLLILKVDHNYSGTLSSKPIIIDFVQDTGKYFTAIEWCRSEFVAVGQASGSIQIYRLSARRDTNVVRFAESFVLGGLRDTVVGCFFGEDSNGNKVPTELYAVDQSGTLVHWVYDSSESDDDESDDDAMEQDDDNVAEEHARIQARKYGWKLKLKQQLLPGNLKCYSCDMNMRNKLIVLGHENGYTLFQARHMLEEAMRDPDDPFGSRKFDGFDDEENETKNENEFIKVQQLDVTDSIIDAIRLNRTAQWIALGSSLRGQLLVWDWRSETYIFKQQSHHSNVRCICYSPIGDLIASGDNEGIVKVFDAKTGHCFVTLSGHFKGPVTGLVFSRPPSSRDPALFASSEDGTCRAFDLMRYKNFRTYLMPNPDQFGGFSNIAVDPSGEIIAASMSQSPYEILLWNVHTKQLLETITSHTGPITSIRFSPAGSKPILASSSWDKTVKIWDVFGSKSDAQVLTHNTEVMSIAFRPDGEELCAATIDGQLSFWNMNDMTQTGFVEARRDIPIDKSIQQTERLTRVQVESMKYFSSVCYTNDGTCVVSGGKHQQYLNLYNVRQRTLLKRFVLSTNLSLRGVANMEELYVTDRSLMRRKIFKIKRHKGSDNAVTIVGQQAIPGSQEQVIPSISCEDLCFSPSNTEFACATPEGIAIFSTQSNYNFQPLDLDPSITSRSIMKTLERGNFGQALLMSIRLNHEEIISKVFNSIPAESIDAIARSIPQNYIERFLTFLAAEIDQSPHLELQLRWAKSVMSQHGRFIFDETHELASIKGGGMTASNTQKNKLQASLRAILRQLMSKYEGLNSICHQNQYSLQFLSTFASSSIEQQQQQQSQDQEMTSENGIQNGDMGPAKIDIKLKHQEENHNNKKRKRTPVKQ